MLSPTQLCYRFLFFLILLAPSACAAEVTALTGVTLHPVTSAPIEDATIVFDESGILEMGKDAKPPEEARVRELPGRHVYPSLIAAHSHLGLVEIPAVRATVDTDPAGDFNPNATAHKAFNPDSELLPVTRSNGVLLALCAPSGGLVSGQSSLMRMSGWTWEDMLLAPRVAMHADWPRAGDEDALRRINRLIEDAAAYEENRSADPDPAPYDIRWEAMLPVLRGEQPLIVDADRSAEIRSAVALAASHDLRLIIHGGYDAPRCAALLKEHDVPVIVSSVHRLPMRRGDPFDAPFTVPERLRAAGVRFCIAGNGRFVSNARNLPYHAATACAYGLPPDEALKAITLYPAQILGVADRVGSLETGKEATLIVADGDPLETPTRVREAYSAGVRVDLDNRHRQLYERFRQRVE